MSLTRKGEKSRTQNPKRKLRTGHFCNGGKVTCLHLVAVLHVMKCADVCRCAEEEVKTGTASGDSGSLWQLPASGCQERASLFAAAFPKMNKIWRAYTVVSHCYSDATCNNISKANKKKQRAMCECGCAPAAVCPKRKRQNNT